MKRILITIIYIFILCNFTTNAQSTTQNDSTYYDFWVGNWYQVVDGKVKEEPRFRVKRGIYYSSFFEEWQMDNYKAKAWRGWDKSTNSWIFVWVSELEHFQVWHEKKLGDHWYMYKSFNINGNKILSRQAFIPQEDGTLIRTSEHSKDNGKTWELRFKEKYVKKERM